MTSEIRANTLKNRVGLGTVSFTNTGPVVSGIVTANTLRLPDSPSGSLGRLQIGNGLDLSLFHNGSNSFLINNTGYLSIQSQDGVNGIFIARNAEVNLYYGPSVRLQTSSSGVTINRDLDVDGHTNLDNVSVAGVSTFTGAVTAHDYRSGGGVGNTLYLTSADDWRFRTTGGSERVRITSGGSVGIGITNPGYRLEFGNILSNNNIKIGSRMTGQNYGIAYGYYDNLSGQHGFGIDRKHGGTIVTNAFVMRADSGYVGMSQDSPATRLDVKQNNGVAYNNRVQTVAYGAARFLNESGHTSGGTYTGFQFNLTGDSQNRICSIGMISEASNNRNSSLVFATDDNGNRTEKLRITSGGQLRVIDGTTSVPSIAAASDTNSGLYFAGADAVGLVAGGSRKLLVNSSGITINNGDLAVNGGNLDVTGDIRHIDNTNTKIAFTSNNIDFQAAGSSRLKVSQYAIYVQSGLPLAFLATSGATPHIKSGGTNAQDLLFTTGSGNPTRMQIYSNGQVELMVPDANDAFKITPAGTNAHAKINFNTPGTGSAILKVQGTERLAINSTGNLTFTGPSNSYATIQYTGNFTKLDLRGNGIANSYHYILSYGAGHSEANDFHMVNKTSGNLTFRTGSSTTERFKINSVGHITKATNPSFHARPPGNYSLSGDTIVGGTWTTNNSESFVRGTMSDGTTSIWDNSTGVFTVPVTGIYFLHWSVFLNNNTTRRDAMIYLNGTGGGNIIARTEIGDYPDTTGTNKNVSVTTVVSLSVNDEIRFGCLTTGGNKIYQTTKPWSYACGYLVG